MTTSDTLIKKIWTYSEWSLINADWYNRYVQRNILGIKKPATNAAGF
jgi:hypothetical protein